MKLKTFYEWAIEAKDEHGDIIDIDFSDKLKNFSDAHYTGDYDVVLYRNVYTMEDYGNGPERDDLDYREYFYPKDEEDYKDMPKKYQKEYDKLKQGK